MDGLGMLNVFSFNLNLVTPEFQSNIIMVEGMLKRYFLKQNEQPQY